MVCVPNNLSTIAIMIYCASLLLIPSAILHRGDDDGHVDRPYDFPPFSTLVLRISLCKYLLYIFTYVQIVSFLRLNQITDFYINIFLMKLEDLMHFSTSRMSVNARHLGVTIPKLLCEGRP